MIIVIRNASGFDLFLAVHADGKTVRARVFAEASAAGTLRAEKIPHRQAFGLGDRPESVDAKVDVSKAGLTLRVDLRREVIDRLDETSEIVGKETYLEFTLLLLN